MTGRTIEELAVGDAAELARPVTADTVREFVAATGDDNPLHSDPAFAASTRFGRVIAPGILTGGLLSALIGTRLPGPGTVYLSQSFRFLRPVLIGDTVTARVEVAEIVRDRNRIRLTTVVRNQEGEAVIEGEAWVMPSRVHVEYRPPAPVAARASTWSATAGLYPYAMPALALELMSLWMSGGLAFARHALQAVDPVRPVPGEPDPVRP